MTPEEFIDRLSGVRETSDPRWRWSARCPGHDDNDPSLSVGVGDDVEGEHDEVVVAGRRDRGRREVFVTPLLV